MGVVYLEKGVSTQPISSTLKQPKLTTNPVPFPP